MVFLSILWDPTSYLLCHSLLLTLQNPPAPTDSNSCFSGLSTNASAYNPSWSCSTSPSRVLSERSRMWHRRVCSSWVVGEQVKGPSQPRCCDVRHDWRHLRSTMTISCNLICLQKQRVGAALPAFVSSLPLFEACLLFHASLSYRHPWDFEWCPLLGPGTSWWSTWLHDS